MMFKESPLAFFPGSVEIEGVELSNMEDVCSWVEDHNSSDDDVAIVSRVLEKVISNSPDKYQVYLGKSILFWGDNLRWTTGVGLRCSRLLENHPGLNAAGESWERAIRDHGY